MVTCGVCGGEAFDKHAGFLYCSVCLTQSQDYYEQEYDYQHHEISTTRALKSKQTPVKEKPELPEDGEWTSWEAFNYILHGMTQEVIDCGATDGFEVTVLKIWAAYLKTCDVAFTSKHSEKLPKLGLTYKTRDARIMYRVDVPFNFSAGKKRIRRSSSRASEASSSSILSKRSHSMRKSKIIAADYEDHLSASLKKERSLADETLESLVNTSTEVEDSGDDSKSVVKSFRKMMNKKDYNTYRNYYQSSRLLARAKAGAEKKIDYMGKNKLLSMIHLALLITRSNIQLSDLLRFIREGHLSYAKVTHFFPARVKLPKKDSTYIDVISDSYMPTHLRQRKIAGQLGRFLKMDFIPTPNIEALIGRYCTDLNLPDELAEMSKKMSQGCWPSSETPRSKTPLPSFEAWAMVSVIFTMKLLFGLNDRTEILFSRLARAASGVKKELFVFEDWQKYIECRKSVLIEHHYPTQEQLNDSSHTSSKKFLEMILKENKDEHRSSRFIPYSRYYMEENLVSGIKEKLEELSKRQNFHFIDFKPSLTPQMSNLETILSEHDERTETAAKLPILRKTFKHCDVQAFVKPADFLSKLKNQDSVDRSTIRDQPRDFVSIEELEDSDSVECSRRYWILDYPNPDSGQLMNFKEKVLEKTPRNFQWLLRECARMLEMNMRDLYDALLLLEKKKKPFE